MAVTIQTLFEEPDSEPEGGAITPAERDLAGPVLKKIFHESPGFEAQFREAMTKEGIAQRAESASKQTSKAAKDAEADMATVRHNSDPESEHELSRVLAAAIAVLLALVDAVPSYFTAEAFGLDQTATVIITVLLVAAIGAAMWLLAMFSARRRLRALRVVEIVLGFGLVIMVVLRAQFLNATSGGSPATALLQAVALTAMSGGLVAVGYIVLEHRKPKVVAAAERTGSQRHATANETKATAERLRASADDARRGLDNYIVPHALKMDPPQGLDHHRFVAALRDVVRGLVAAQDDPTSRA